MFKDNIVLAIIPARGGSKTLPRKNIKKLGNKPLLAYTVKEALKSKYIDRAIVSTDDDEIAQIAKNYGAEIPFLRPKKFARDDSLSISVVLHCLDYLKEKENYSPDIVVFLPPTAPFRRTKHIDEGIEKIEHYQAVAGVCPVKQHPYFMMKKDNEDLLSPYINIQTRPERKQDVPQLYYVNTSLYIAKREYYDRAGYSDPIIPLYEEKLGAVFMDEVSSVDIDTELDFLWAEFLNQDF